MWYWYIIGAVVVLAVLYLAAICPRLKRPDMKALYGVYYAHRGLHDNKTDAPENSMAAFEKAVQGGYGIEFDVQLTKDRVPVVFHDETLLRVCGVDRKVRDCTWDELQQYRLCGSDATIPLLSDVLALVNGQVPLIIEIKAHESPAEVCRWSDPLIAAYHGPYCVESFDPFMLHWYKKHAPQAIRGQLCYDQRRAEGKYESLFMFFYVHRIVHCYCKTYHKRYEPPSRYSFHFHICWEKYTQNDIHHSI
jgi:glycerophosphoryl diester phosphodiesterase